MSVGGDGLFPESVATFLKLALRVIVFPAGVIVAQFWTFILIGNPWLIL